MSKRTQVRKLLIVTGSRGEYGYIRPLLKELERSKTMKADILATNMHLLPEFGNSIKELSRDGFQVQEKIYMSLAGYTNATMVKSLGVFLLSLTDYLSNHTPDIILLAGDRGEQLMTAIAGAHMNIPVAHIQAGETSGNVDGMSRHAMARFAHLHFAANEDARRRLIRSGEEPFRVHQVGAPQLDDFVQGHLVPATVVARRYGLDLTKPVVLVVQHPVTEQALLAGEQMAATMQAIIALGHQAVVIYPNNDAGSVAVQSAILENRNIHIRVERNLPRDLFGGLMRTASVIVGNSSAGIIEAPFFKLPAVNIGRRQEGRFQGGNVIDVPQHNTRHIISAIQKALSRSFRTRVLKAGSPYGDGHSSRRILHTLNSVAINEKLLFKKMTF